jgi:hypothetical protein|tara:strand:+ start:303 stop:1076 length:774 start_codon:yes stop_codon:yes gene_type:complete
MSRTLKRPMFRRGGEVNDGIVGLAQPRRNYSTGKTREEMIEEIFETSGLTKSGKSYAETAMRLANLGRPSDQDLLTNVLIQGGLKGLSTTGGGSAVANLAKAFEGPTTQALKQRTAGKGLGVAGAMKGLELGIKKDIADKALQSKIGKGFESGTLAAITKEVQNALGKDVVGEEARIKAVNLAPKVAKARTTPGIFYQGILIMDKKDTSKPDLGYMASQPDGAIFLNPNNNLFYTKDDNKLKLVDQQTLKLDVTEEE